MLQLSQNAVMQENLTVYGIPNCDTVKKSRAWLVAGNVPHSFHDYKKLGVPEAALRRWVQALGWEALVNKKGSTWRKLSATDQALVADAAAAVALMLRESSVIKRPVVEGAGLLTAGYAPAQWLSWSGGAEVEISSMSAHNELA